MEVGLWVVTDSYLGYEVQGLNPCFSGSWFVRKLKDAQSSFDSIVLILVLVEVGLWEVKKRRNKVKKRQSLNPCFSGSWFVSIILQTYIKKQYKSLNPCFSGSWFVRIKNRWE